MRKSKQLPIPLEPRPGDVWVEIPTQRGYRAGMFVVVSEPVAKSGRRAEAVRKHSAKHHYPQVAVGTKSSLTLAEDADAEVVLVWWVKPPEWRHNPKCDLVSVEMLRPDTALKSNAFKGRWRIVHAASRQ